MRRFIVSCRPRLFARPGRYPAALCAARADRDLCRRPADAGACPTTPPPVAQARTAPAAIQRLHSRHARRHSVRAARRLGWSGGIRPGPVAWAAVDCRPQRRPVHDLPDHGRWAGGGVGGDDRPHAGATAAVASGNITELGTQHGLRGLFVRSGAQFQVFYATPDGQRVIPGVMWDAAGKDITRQQVAHVPGAIPTVVVGGADPATSTGPRLRRRPCPWCGRRVLGRSVPPRRRICGC